MRLLVSLVFVACTPKTPAPAAPLAGSTDDMSATMGFDPDVRHGVLDNGLRWFIEVNDHPKDRAVLRLVVDAGSALEDDDQLGLAHFLEHMAFNGTEHFPGNEMISYLEGVGTQFGPHLNAHTSFDETVYKLTVPTDDPEVFGNALQVLDDWAGGMTLDPAEIDAERGVVIEEWRTRLNAGGRIFEQTAPLLFKDSTYADRLPIGTKESLEGFDHDALRRFYDDWYRPDLMSVIVVGSVDPDEVEALIAEHFGDLPTPATPRERQRFPIPPHAEALYKVVSDPEVTRASFSLMSKHDDVEGQTVGDYRTAMVEGLAYRMVNERFAELARQAEPPFLGAGAGPRRLGPTEGADSLGAATAEDGILEGLDAVWEEVERLRRHGFTASELQRAVDNHLRMYDRLDKERDTTPSKAHAQELIRHVLHQETVPGLDVEIDLARRWLPQITLGEVDAWTAEWMPEDSRVITAVLPEKDGLVPPTEDQLLSTIEAVLAREIAPPAEEEALPELVPTPPTPGTIAEVDDQYLDGLDFRGWVLSNGVKVYYRSTDFTADEVRFTSFAAGGTSNVPDGDYIAAITATDVLHASGFGPMNATQVRRWLSGKSLSLSHRIGEISHGVSGRASPSDLEAALRLLHVSLQTPRFTADGMAFVTNNKREELRNRDQSPDVAFSDAWTELVWPGIDRYAPWDPSDVDEMSLEGSKRIYDELFSDLGGSTFVFVGNLPDDFEALVTTWLGSLPASKPPAEVTQLPHTPAPGPQSATVRRGLEAQAKVKLGWHTAFPDQDWLSRNRLFAMGKVLRTQLREELREEMGGVYGVGASATNWEMPDWSMVQVSFTCDPERVEELTGAVEKVVAKLIAEPVDLRYVEQLQEQNRRSREEQVRSNGFWMSSFAGSLERGEDPNALLTWTERNDSLTPAAIQEAAKRFLDVEHTVEVVLLPE